MRVIRVIAAAVALLASALSASAQSVLVAIGQNASVASPGATAAYLIDQTVADVTLDASAVRVHGRRAGLTKLVVVTGDQIQAYDLQVRAVHRSERSPQVAPTMASSVWSTGYSSETERLTTSVDSTSQYGRRMTRVSASNVTSLAATRSDARSSIASASVDFTSGTQRITLLDQLVRSSPLTLDGSRVRGLHYSDAAFDLHAGLSSPLLYRSVILPAESDGVVGGSYTTRRGPVSIRPSLYWFPRESSFGGASGVSTGVRVQRAHADARFRMSAEGGYGGNAAAAAADLSYDGARHELALATTHRPTGYPSLGGISPYGTSFDGNWSARLTKRLSFEMAATGARHELPASEQRTGHSSAELRAMVGRQWTFSLGSDVGLFDNGVSRVTSVTMPVGARWAGSRAGVHGLFRYQRNTDRNSGGAGGRVRANAAIGQVSLSGFVDYQRDAATVGLVFRESPELGSLFAELGFETQTPEDLARLLREHASLVTSGYLERATLILNPERVQTALDAIWRSRGGAMELRFNLMANRVETTRDARNHLLETLSWTQGLTRRVAVTVSTTWWTSERGGYSSGRRSYAVGLRLRGTALTDLTSWFRRDALTGRVFLDDDHGAALGRKPPMSAVRVRLDDGRETLTDGAGRFRFDDVGSGARRVEVLLPITDGARFTSPAVVLARPGEDAIFSIGYVAARVIGEVRDDAGAAVAGVLIRANCEGAQGTAVTDSAGRYALSGTEGDCRIGIDGASLPEGYDGSGIPERTVRFARAIPARADYVVRANRTLSGVLKGSDESATIRLSETAAVQSPDADGRFVFRNLKPGTYTVIAEVGGRRVERVVIVPEGPSLMMVELNLN